MELKFKKKNVHVVCMYYTLLMTLVKSKLGFQNHANLQENFYT